MAVIITRRSDALSLAKYSDEVCPSLVRAITADDKDVYHRPDVYFFLGESPKDFISGVKVQEMVEFEPYTITVEIETDATTGDVAVKIDYSSITPRPDSLSRIKDVIDAACIKKILCKMYPEHESAVRPIIPVLATEPKHESAVRPIIPILATEPRTAKIFHFIKDDERIKFHLVDDGRTEEKELGFNSSSYEASSLGFSRDKTMLELLTDCSVQLIRIPPLVATFTPSYDLTLSDVSDAHDAMTVLTPSLENALAITGGVGAVVSDLAEEFSRSELSVTNHIISPDYDFLASMSKELYLTVRHMFKGEEVTSDIFETEINGYKQYLVSPCSRSTNKVFSVGGAHGIYAHNINSSLMERGAYLASATAAFVAATKYYNIIHQHSWATALTRRLVQQRLGDGIHIPKFITTVHGLLGETAMAPIDLVRGVGIELPQGWEADSFNLFYECIDNTDLLVMVSRFLSESACTDDIPLRAEYIAARDSRRMRCVGNGVSLSRVSPALQDGLGFNPHAIVSSKHTAKISLAESGIITDPDRPLFLFVGRFAPEKGVKSLPSMARSIIERGGSVIIVGRGDSELAAGIDSMLEMDIYEGCLYISLNDDEFQHRHLPLIRAAADFQLVPSVSETYGLVAIESMLNGAVLVTTAVEGLKDIVRPLEVRDGHVISSGNSFAYDRDGEPDAAIENAFSFHNTVPAAEKEEFFSNLMKEGEGYSWARSAMAYSALYDELYPEARATLDARSGGASKLGYK